MVLPELLGARGRVPSGSGSAGLSAGRVPWGAAAAVQHAYADLDRPHHLQFTTG